MDHGSLILGELREFKRATLERLETIEKQLLSDRSFKDRALGIAAFIAFVASTAATLAVEWYRSK